MSAIAWQSVKLGDICEFKYGKSLPAAIRTNAGHPVYGSNGIVGFHDSTITLGASVIVGRKGSFGEINYSQVSSWPIDTTYFVDQTATSVDLKWLFYLLRTLGLNKLNRSAAIPGLNREDAYSKTLLLPPLIEQKRIAAILDQAEALRSKRLFTLANVDLLSDALFKKIFGNVLVNDFNWDDSRLLGSCAEIVSGFTKGRKLGEKSTSAIPYLTVANVQDKHLKLDVVKTDEATEFEIERYRLVKGDLLLTEGGDPDKLGRGTLWNDELPLCIHQNHVFRVRLTTDEITPIFLNWLVGSARGKHYFFKSAKQTTGIASINMTQLKAFPLLIPPMAIQRQFESAIERNTQLKVVQEKQFSGFNALFASLQHRAFRGEL